MEFQSIMIIWMGIISILTLAVVIKLFLDKSTKLPDLSAQLIDLKNQISEMKTKQLEAQNAISNRVIPVSPNSFYSYLMAIAYGLKGFKIEQQAREILKSIGSLQELLKKFFDDHTKTGKHLQNALSSYENSNKQLTKLNDKMAQITGIDMKLIDEN